MGDSTERIKGEVCWFWLADSPSAPPLYSFKNANASVSACMEDQEEDEEEEANEEQGSEEFVCTGSFHFSWRRRRRHTAVRLGKLSLGKAWQQSPGQSRGVYPLPRRHERNRGVRVRIEEWEEMKKGDGEVSAGSLKRTGSVSRGETGGMKGEWGDCVLQPSGPFTDPERWHWQLKNRRGRGAGESSVQCLKREVCLYYFNLIHSATLTHTHAYTFTHSDIYCAL